MDFHIFLLASSPLHPMGSPHNPLLKHFPPSIIPLHYFYFTLTSLPHVPLQGFLFYFHDFHLCSKLNTQNKRFEASLCMRQKYISRPKLPYSLYFLFKFCFFLHSRVIFHCAYAAHFSYPYICWCASKIHITTMKQVAVNMYVQVSPLKNIKFEFIFKFNSVIGASFGSSISSVLKTIQNYFQSDCISL